MRFAWAAGAAACITEAYGRKVYIAGETPNEINGIKILHGTRGSKPMIGFSEAYNQLSFAQDPDFDTKLKNGSISSVKFTQNDVDIIAQTSTTGKFDFYETFPISKSAEELNNLPALSAQVPSGFTDKPIDFNHFEIPGISGHFTQSGFVASQHNKTRRGVLLPRASPELQGDLWASILPELDPFYTPLGQGNKPHGTPIAYRKVSHPSYFGDVSSYQLTYTTENSQGGSNSDLTTIYVPKNADPNYFVTYQMHEDGDQLFCAYSFLLTLGYTDVYLRAFLRHNFAVSVTDYEGRQSVFGAYLRGARSVLDSISGVRQSLNQLKITADNSFIYGYSSGATTTGLAAEILTSYFPSLTPHIPGMALGGYATNITASFNAVNAQHFGGLIPMSLVSIMKEYSSALEFVASHITPLGAIQLPIAGSGCSPTLYLFLGQDMYDITTVGSGITTDPTLAPIWDENSPGQRAPPMPVFFLQTTSDEVAPLAIFEQVVNLYCQGGTPIAWHRTNADGHGKYEQHMPQYVPQFFESIKNGASQAKTCSSWQDVAFI